MILLLSTLGFPVVVSHHLQEIDAVSSVSFMFSFLIGLTHEADKLVKA